MTRILVTGAAGFIGSHVCEALLRAGHQVLGLDSFDPFYDLAVKRQNLAAVIAHPAFQLIEGDVRDERLLGEVVGGEISAVVHLAARAGVRPSMDDPQTYYDVNVRGTLTLLQACAATRPRFIFGSSSSVYGNTSRVPFREDDAAGEPISPYAASKRAGELLCHTFHHLYGIPVTCLRFFTVYGPRQRPDLAIHKFARLLAAGRPIPMFGDGSMRRDYTYVDDIVDGIQRAIDRCAGFRIYNLGNSSPVPLLRLISELERVLPAKATIERHEASRGDVECTYADIGRAAEELGYRPGTTFEAGLARFAEWFRGPIRFAPRDGLVFEPLERSGRGIDHAAIR